MSQELFGFTHARAYCKIDEWIGLTMAQVRVLEGLCKEALSLAGVGSEADGKGEDGGAAAAVASSGGDGDDSGVSKAEQVEFRQRLLPPLIWRGSWW